VGFLISLRHWLPHALVWLIVFLNGCSIAGDNGAFRDQEKISKRIFVVHDRWHSAIVIRTADILMTAVPEAKDFSSAEHLEFSWGDKDYFPNPDPGLGLAFKAAFWSSGSILHLVGINGAVANSYTGAEVIEAGLSHQGLERLLGFISATFSRPQPGVATHSQPGLFPNSRFYPARGKFSLFRNCNTWVAEALRSAGLPVNSGLITTASSVGNQVRRFRITR